MSENASTLPAERTWFQLVSDRKILSWALYDWGNSAFATTVMSGFFPIFFKQYWSDGVSAVESTAKLGYANSVGSLLIGLSAPFLGALADRSQGRKKLLFFFTMIGVLSTASLYFVQRQEWVIAAALYVFGSIGFSGAQSFYDALLVAVARPKEMDHVSAIGYALGYLGGGVLFAVNVAMTLKPEFFGLANAAEAVQASFLMVGIWWLVFTLPLLFVVKEPPSSQGSTPSGHKSHGLFKETFHELKRTFNSLRSMRSATLFLIGYFFYIDGVNTVIKMAVDYCMSLGFESKSLIVALLLVQFVSFPAAIGFGFIAKRLSARTSIYIAIAAYVVITTCASVMQLEWHFYALAVLIGLVQGGIQAQSRAVFGQMTPKDKSGEFFGFFNMIGRLSSVLGPTLVGITGIVFDSPRVGMLSLLSLFAVGYWFLTKVEFPDEKANKA